MGGLRYLGPLDGGEGLEHKPSAKSPGGLTYLGPLETGDDAERPGFWEEMVRPYVRGFKSAVAGTNQLAANLFGVLDTAAKGLSQATGLSYGDTFKLARDWAAQNAKDWTPEKLDDQGLVDQIVEGVTEGVLRLPEYATFGRLMGPVAGFAAHGALSEADKDWRTAVMGALQGGLTGGLFEVTKPLKPVLRGLSIGTPAAWSAHLAGADDKEALASGVSLGLFGAVGHKGRIGVREGLERLRQEARERLRAEEIIKDAAEESGQKVVDDAIDLIFDLNDAGRKREIARRLDEARGRRPLAQDEAAWQEELRRLEAEEPTGGMTMQEAEAIRRAQAARKREERYRIKKAAWRGEELPADELTRLTKRELIEIVQAKTGQRHKEWRSKEWLIARYLEGLKQGTETGKDLEPPQDVELPSSTPPQDVGGVGLAGKWIRSGSLRGQVVEDRGKTLLVRSEKGIEAEIPNGPQVEVIEDPAAGFGVDLARLAPGDRVEDVKGNTGAVESIDRVDGELSVMVRADKDGQVSAWPVEGMRLAAERGAQEAVTPEGLRDRLTEQKIREDQTRTDLFQDQDPNIDRAGKQDQSNIFDFTDKPERAGERPPAEPEARLVSGEDKLEDWIRERLKEDGYGTPSRPTPDPLIAFFARKMGYRGAETLWGKSAAQELLKRKRLLFKRGGLSPDSLLDEAKELGFAPREMDYDALYDYLLEAKSAADRYHEAAEEWRYQATRERPDGGFYSHLEHPDGRITLPPDERARLIEEVFEYKKKASELGQQPKLVMTGGPPGAGKSTSLKAAGVKPDRFVEVNADLVKELAGLDDRAPQFHEDSSEIAKEVLERAMSGGYHVLYDSLLTNFPLADGLIKRALAKGMKVTITFNNIGPITSIVRSKVRRLKGETRRDVPIEASLKGWNRALPTFLELYKKWGDDPRINWYLVDNNVDGRKPVNVFQKVDGRLTIFDREHFDFLMNTDYNRIITDNGEVRYERATPTTKRGARAHLARADRRIRRLREGDYSVHVEPRIGSPEGYVPPGAEERAEPGREGLDDTEPTHLGAGPAPIHVKQSIAQIEAKHPALKRHLERIRDFLHGQRVAGETSARGETFTRYAEFKQAWIGQEKKLRNELAIVSRQWVKDVPDLLDREAATIYSEYKSNFKLARELAAKIKDPDVRDHVEELIDRAEKIKRAENDHYRRLRAYAQYFDRNTYQIGLEAERAKMLSLIRGANVEYVHHWWQQDTPQVELIPGEGGGTGPRAAARQHRQYYRGYIEGIAEGKRPETLDRGRLYLKYVDEVQHDLRLHQLLNDLWEIKISEGEHEGKRIWGLTGHPDVEGPDFVEVDLGGFRRLAYRPMTYDEQTKLFKLLSAKDIEAGQAPIGTVAIPEKIRVYRPIAEDIKALFAVSKLENWRPWEMAKKVNYIMKRAKLAASGFHHLAFVRNNLVLAGPLRLLANWRHFNPFGGFHKTGLKSLEEAVRGRKHLIKTKLTGGEVDSTPIIQRALERGILTLSEGQMADYLHGRDLPEKMRSDWADAIDEIDAPKGNKVVNAAKTVIRKFDEALWDRAYVGSKVTAFLLEYERYRKAHPEWSLDRVLDTAARDINNLYGGLEYRLINNGAARAKVAQDAARMFLLAPDWTESNWRYFFSGMRELARGVNQIAGLKAPTAWFSGPGANLIKIGMWWALVTQLTNMALNDGETTWKHERAKKLYAKIPKNSAIGRALGFKEDYYIDLLGHLIEPGKVALRGETLAEGIERHFFYKLSQIAGVLYDVVTPGGYDWAGRHAAGLNDLLKGKLTGSRYKKPEGALGKWPGVAVNTARRFLPIPADAALEMALGTKEAPETIGSVFGLHLTPDWSARGRRRRREQSAYQAFKARQRAARRRRRTRVMLP